MPWRFRLRTTDDAGFTLVEMVVVIAILGLLAAIALPRLAGVLGDANARNAAYRVAAEIRTAQALAQAEHTSSRILFLPNGWYEIQTATTANAAACPGVNHYALTISAKSTDANLSGLTLSHGSIAFSPSATSYALDYDANVAQVSITPVTSSPDASLTINGASHPSGQPMNISLPAGQTTQVNIVVTAGDGTTTKVYSLDMHRASSADLASLAVSEGALNPVFAPGQQEYTVQVAYSTSVVHVGATARDASAAVVINGTPQTGNTPQTITLNGPGNPTVVSVAVTGADGSAKTYTITVSRQASPSTNVDLSALTITPGTWNQPFDPGTTMYTISIPFSTTAVVLTPTAADPASQLSIEGTPLTSGQPQTVPITANNMLVDINVVAEDGVTTNDYYIVIKRATAPSTSATLKSLSLTPGTLSPGPFSSNQYSYSTNVFNWVQAVTLQAQTTHAAATVTVNGQPYASGAQLEVPLGSGATSTITLVVTAEDHVTQRTYTVTVTRIPDTTLADLALDVTNLAFAPNTTNYPVSVHSGTATVSVTATLNDPRASLRINGTTQASGSPVPVTLLGPGQITTIPVLVTAEDGVNSQQYTVTVSREGAGSTPNLAELASLAVSQGGMDPQFSPTTRTYTATVPQGLDHVDITAVTADLGATLMINGLEHPSRQSYTVPLGSSDTVVSIDVVSAGRSVGFETRRRVALPSDIGVTFGADSTGCLAFGPAGRLVGAAPTVVHGSTQAPNPFPGYDLDTLRNRLVDGITLADPTTTAWDSDTGAVNWTTTQAWDPNDPNNPDDPGDPVDRPNTVCPNGTICIVLDLGQARTVSNACAGALQRTDVLFPEKVMFERGDGPSGPWTTLSPSGQPQANPSSGRLCIGFASDQPVKYLRAVMVPNQTDPNYRFRLALDEIEVSGPGITVVDKQGHHPHGVVVTPITGRVTVR